MTLRTTAFLFIALVCTLVPSTTAHAQVYRTVYGANPLERISGADYAALNNIQRQITTSNFVGTYLPPTYTSRYGLNPVRGGSFFPSRSWDVRVGGNGVDPRTGVNMLNNRNDVYVYPYNRVSGGAPVLGFGAFSSYGAGPTSFSGATAPAGRTVRLPWGTTIRGSFSR